mmetsp:Transcript_58385/g.121240  ORF Transcript_58385/g.121240 Transcript_58385/m.121240 type:complete len:375 (+) Transcript_58385:3-1127(+)
MSSACLHCFLCGQSHGSIGVRSRHARAALPQLSGRAAWLGDPTLKKDDRRASRRREAAGLIAIAAAVSVPAVARAGPFVSFLSDVLPLKEAQRAFARADWEIRDGVNRVTEVVASPVKPPEVPDATGAEAAVMAAGRAAADAAGLDRQKLARRQAELAEQEPKRLRGRAEAGLFETEMLGSVTMHMAANLEKPSFQAYCSWRAFGEALREMSTASTTKFRRVFGQQLLAGRLRTFPPKPTIKASPEQATVLVSQIQAALVALTDAGLCSKVTPQVDEVLVEVWGEGGSEELVLPILIEGDPLVDAQLLLSEELAPPVLPDPILAVLTAWLEEAAGPGYASLQNYYVNSRWRGRSEYSNMVYVPKQRLFQLTLHR